MIRNSGNNAGLVKPEFVCDVCGRTIRSLAEGRAVITGKVEEGVAADVKHVHAGECLARAELETHGGWVTLDSHLRDLCRGYGIREVAAAREREPDVIL